MLQMSLALTRFRFQMERLWRWMSGLLHCVKSIRIRSYSGPHFLTFGLNSKRYSVSLRIQSECEKMRTKITPNTSTFYAVLHISLIYQITICCSIVIYFAVVWFTCFLCLFQEEIFLKQLAIHCPEYENIMSTKCNY